MRALIGLSLFVVAGMAQAQSAQCGAVAAPQALPVRPTVIAPIAPELVAPSHQLGHDTPVASLTAECWPLTASLMRRRGSQPASD